MTSGTTYYFMVTAFNADGSTLIFNLAGPDLTLSASPNTVAIAAGKAALYSLTLSPINQFTAEVLLTCSGVPPRATCSLDSVSVILDGTNSATATVTVQTTAPMVAAGPVVPIFHFPKFSWMLLFVLVGALLEARRRRYPSKLTNIHRIAWTFAVAFLFSMLWASCGNSAPPSENLGTPPGTPPGTRTLTVTATVGSFSRSVPLTLTVN